MASGSKIKTRVIIVVGALVAIVAVARLIDRVNFRYRQQWHYVASLQDLPPVDRSHWPKPPMAWSNETVEIQAATRME